MDRSFGGVTSALLDEVVKETKRSGLSGRPHCKGVAIGVARRRARRSGERTLRIPPSCSDPASHSCGPRVASFVRLSSVLAQLNFMRAGAARGAMRSKQKQRTAGKRPAKASDGLVRVRSTSGRSASAARRGGRAHPNGAIFVNIEGCRPCLGKPSYEAPQWALVWSA